MKLLLCIALVTSTSVCNSQSLFQSIREGSDQHVSAYIFVSSDLPTSTLIPLARDAQRAGLSMVLNGFSTNGAGGLDATKSRVAEINNACCGKNGAHWQINPLLYQRYKIKAIPAFVIARGTGDLPEDYSKVSGEMSLANALKFFSQASKIPLIKAKANEVYIKAFSTQ